MSSTLDSPPPSDPAGTGTTAPVGTTPPAGGTALPETANHARNRTRRSLLTWQFGLAIVFTLGLLVASLFVGVYDVWNNPDGWEMFLITRVPRTIALVLAGATLAMCGLVMQLLTQNRFVSPSTAGTTEWAGLGLLLAMILFPHGNLMVKMTLAIIASFIGTVIFFAFLQRVRLRSSVIVPIVGMMMGAIVGALSSFIALSTDMLQNVGIWFAGSFTSVVEGQWEPLLVTILVVVAVFVTADRFTVAGLGEEIATNVGLNYRSVMYLGTGLIAIATGVITVVVGNLPFIGLIVPNIVSMIRGDDLRSNLPWVALAGIWIVAVCDLIGRTIIMPFEVPVSLILGVVGSVVFVILILRTRRHG
ncbi:ABC transporter permease [Brevibacterium samyangense]|uniref:Iron chelate uptake ABC transporter family permease subunit n=1 Tax=Brevibacterium samyangense TaxID=366888 RepID=A0ABN2TF49_9MICO